MSKMQEQMDEIVILMIESQLNECAKYYCLSKSFQ